MVALTWQERLKFCDIHFLELVLILMRNDSAAYTFAKLPEVRRKCTEEFNQSSKLMIYEQQ